MTSPERDSESGESGAEDANVNVNSPNRAMDHIEQLERFIHTFFDILRKPCATVKRIAKYLMVERGGYEAIDKSIKWMIQNPLFSLTLLMASLIFLPILMIAGFFVFSIVIALTGIVVIEGTLLTFVSIISVGSLVALVIVFFIIAAVFLAVYMGFAHIYDIYGRGNIIALSDFLKKAHEPVDNRTNADNRGDPSIASVGPT